MVGIDVVAPRLADMWEMTNAQQIGPTHRSYYCRSTCSHRGHLL